MIYKIQYKTSVTKDLRKIEKQEAGTLLDAIGNALAKDPVKGIQSKDEFKELFRYSTGNHRIVYAVLGDTVLVLRIDHENEAYGC